MSMTSIFSHFTTKYPRPEKSIVLDVRERLAVPGITAKDHRQIFARQHAFRTGDECADQPVHLFETQRILILDAYQPLRKLLDFRCRQRLETRCVHRRLDFVLLEPAV